MTTALEIHVGGLCEGDVVEAHSLEAAVREREAGGLTCTCHVHPEYDHSLAGSMRDSGALHDLLCRLVGARDAEASSAPVERLPEGFVGFADVEDF